MMLRIYLVLIAALGLFMGVQIFIDKAGAQGLTPVVDYCAMEFDMPDPNDPTKTIHAKPIYNNEDLDTEAIMELYHTTINEQFNWYIATMIGQESSVVKTGVSNPNGLPPEPTASSPQIPGPCPEANYSTYCVANRLLTQPDWGYLTYYRSLNCRRSQLFETTKQKDAWNSWIETTTCLGVPCTPEKEAELEKEIGGIYQNQQVLQVSARLEAIDREQKAAKRAFDQTLAAYNELRTAWPMHKEYVQIYESLLKYRDNLVEVRHQVEELPAKFIDATTTKCT